MVYVCERAHSNKLIHVLLRIENVLDFSVQSHRGTKKMDQNWTLVEIVAAESFQRVLVLRERIDTAWRLIGFARKDTYSAGLTSSEVRA